MIEKPFRDSRNRIAILKNETLNEADQSLDSVSHCKAIALKYEQLGYHVGVHRNLMQLSMMSAVLVLVNEYML
ncbi:MAG TPA: hypothetical protein VH500_12750 [Nitrososphaeraceae archaeon]